MTSPVRIPADVDMPDRVIGPLTGRQAAILAATGLLLYSVWDETRPFLPPAAFLAVAVPIAVAAIAVALGSRDGVTMDRMVIAAIRHRASPRTRVARPPDAHPASRRFGGRSVPTRHGPGSSRRRAPLRLPATSVAQDNAGVGVGVMDLGADGVAVVAVASTVTFALRTPAEQQSLVTTFARYLHSLSAPVQILIRAERLDLGGPIAQLRAAAAHSLHPALAAAALDHAAFLDRLTGETLLRRQVLLVMRDPNSTSAPARPTSESSIPGSPDRGGRRGARAGAGSRRAGEIRLARRLADAVDLLAPAGITVTPSPPPTPAPASPATPTPGRGRRRPCATSATPSPTQTPPAPPAPTPTGPAGVMPRSGHSSPSGCILSSTALSTAYSTGRRPPDPQVTSWCSACAICPTNRRQSAPCSRWMRSGGR